MKDQFKPTELMVADGSLFDLDDAANMTVDPDVILQSLCTQVRFNGHLSCYYTVGSHVVAMYAAANAMEEPSGVLKGILLHDMHEFITGDIPSPVKRLLQPAVGELEAEIDKAIFAHFRYLPTPAETARIKEYDAMMWQMELHVWQDVAWDRLEDDLFQATRRAVAKLGTMTVAEVAQSYRSALLREFRGSEVMQ